ncbi:MAG: prepilin-type N-terminal cleavage/methylation domain-containing protein, partial [Thermodesulfovibrionales bacterium]
TGICSRTDRRLCGSLSRRLSRRSGFTLLEIVLVVFIISLFAAMALPSFSNVGSGGLKNEAKKLASLLRYLNDSSIYTKKSFQLNFDFREKRVSWNGPEGEKSQELGKITAVTLASKGVLREGQVIIFFGPLGLGENIEITLNKGEHEARVSMNSLSGRVKITSND